VGNKRVRMLHQTQEKKKNTFRKEKKKEGTNKGTRVVTWFGVLLISYLPLPRPPVYIPKSQARRGAGTKRKRRPCSGCVKGIWNGIYVESPPQQKNIWGECEGQITYRGERRNWLQKPGGGSAALSTGTGRLA